MLCRIAECCLKTDLSHFFPCSQFKLQNIIQDWSLLIVGLVLVIGVSSRYDYQKKVSADKKTVIRLYLSKNIENRPIFGLLLLKHSNSLVGNLYPKSF